ncbi:type I pullulanase [Jeotgalibaca sp. MA1X17-3]|uniref:type I pullulanase n=1 Tax=Jeotgalibaca sp. MA1X17-3 TaxID=2908211 RepID=UPI001F366C45|nr:type I pullulanase [Jeotgalibaca sp. MA1X17-3]UJF15219.1 type I pullulanase [Jeotgalibaca sp. MA1X17-3]
MEIKRHSGNWPTAEQEVSDTRATYNFNTGLIEIDPTFDDRYAYAGALGCFYSKSSTVYRVWAPAAILVELIMYDGYYGEELQRIPMDPIANGTYEIELVGDLDETSYKYAITYPDETIIETLDPYSTAVTINGERSAVVDLKSTNPENWKKRMSPFSSTTDAIIYEVHVRDFTISESSGVKEKGKYLGMIEKGTRSPNGKATGLDYLKELGVTHVQILPMFDFCTVDEEDPSYRYNWGYDPQNYNAPEGSYATDARNPKKRIKELKQMIQGLHDAGIRVIMDVVYNHVYKYETHPFENTAPGYFFRRNEEGNLSDGSGCGNDTASEHKMMRKYMLDSVTYWAEEFHVDGFRFDLMGLHDVETMNQVREALDKIDPSMIIIGEGWHLDTSLSAEQKANSKNAFQTKRIGFFNDALRDAVKGSDMGDALDTGFITGKGFMEQWIAINQQGGAYYPVDVATYQSPDQMVQYVEAHDNYTLYDKLRMTMPDDNEQTRKQRHMLAQSITLLSQGIPFLHAGQEFMRTKQGVGNSYRSPDEINQMDWLRKDENEEVVEYIKNLIALRQSDPLFRMKTTEEISKHMELIHARDYRIVLQLENEERIYYLLFNADGHPFTFQIEHGVYKQLVHDGTVELENPTVFEQSEEVRVEGFSTTVLVREKN